jgi:predicted ester cyclase
VVPSTETEANKANIRRYVDEALNRGILDVIDETRGELAEHAKEKVVAWRNAFPDFHTTIETLVAEDDWVAYNVRHQGTHEGEFEGVAPTGKHVEFRTMVFNRFADGMSWRTGDCTTTQVSWSNSAPISDRGALAASPLPGLCELAAIGFYPCAIACQDCDQEMSLARRANPRATVMEYRTQH